nr:MAG TPA: hypothetical protein [Caudoviricetes sp.]
MKRQDIENLKVACMNAEIDINNWYRHVGQIAKVSMKVVFQGTMLNFVVDADNVDEAKEKLFQMLKKRFSRRFASSPTRKTLEAPSLEAQRHLLFWKDHMDLYDVIKTYSDLCALIPQYPGSFCTKKEKTAYDKANNAAGRFYRIHNLNVIKGYKLSELMWQYKKVPTAWIKAYKAKKVA